MAFQRTQSKREKLLYWSIWPNVMSPSVISLTSVSTTGPFAYSIPGTLASLLILECAKHSPVLRPLLFSSAWTLFPKIFTWLTPCLPLSLCSNITSHWGQIWPSSLKVLLSPPYLLNPLTLFSFFPHWTCQCLLYNLCVSIPLPPLECTGQWG